METLRLHGCTVVFLRFSPASFSFPAALWLQEVPSNQKPMMYCSIEMHSNFFNNLVIISSHYPSIPSWLFVHLNGQMIIEQP